MALDCDPILLHSLRDSLSVYQRAVWWSMTATVAFFLLSLRLGDPNRPPVRLPYGELNAPLAWGVALFLFVLFGGYALSAIRRAELVLSALHPTPEVREAIVLSPSLATSANGLYRVGTVLFCPVTILVAFIIELRREWAGQSLSTKLSENWIGLLLFCLLVLGLYLWIVTHVWRPFGSRLNKPLQPPNGTDPAT